jgi:hypothetical protein
MRLRRNHPFTRNKLALTTGTLLVLLIAGMAMRSVLAPLLATAPYPLSACGVARISASETFAVSGGYARITMSSDSTAPFFVVRVLVMLKTPVEADIVLDSIIIDGTNTIAISSFSPKVVVVSAGTMAGEIVTSLPDRLNILLVKEPMGNAAIAANGGGTNGLVFVLRFSSGAYSIGTTMTAIVTAPSNATLSIALS